MKKCYYEILGVDNKATNSQIKSSYRKLALKYHPDKNPSEEAKAMFVEITEAYNVLSDPNERTWYDNNREKILFNKEQMSKQDVQAYSFGFNIWNYFTGSCFKGFEDDENGFFSVYRGIFQKIKAEEAKAFGMREDLQQQIRKYEGFGVSDTNLERVLKFYEDWQNFTTYKTFIWAEDWDTREAPNRYVKREMEKQNKKQRQKEKKNYIKTIKDLISFLKKRDPRYREYLIKQKEEEQKRQIQKKKREEEKKKQKEQMKKVREQLEEERFKQIEQYYREQNIKLPEGLQDNDQEVDEYEEAPEFFCEICQKAFKSSNQLQNHQKSKMHKQKVKELQKQVMSKQQMVLEAKKSAEQEEVINEPVSKKSKNRRKKKKKNQQEDQKDNQKSESEQEEQIQKKNKKEEKKAVKEDQPKKKSVQIDEEDDSDDDMDAFMNMMGKKKVSTQDHQQKIGKKEKKLLIPQSQSEESAQEKKIGKAKQKREKKAQKLEKEKDVKFRCNVCSEPFQSKTKLFDHIKKTGHAKAK